MQQDGRRTRREATRSPAPTSADPSARTGLTGFSDATTGPYRHVITEGIVEDGDGNPVGRIRLLRKSQHEVGHYEWQAGLLKADAAGACATYEDAKAAILSALRAEGERRK